MMLRSVLLVALVASCRTEVHHEQSPLASTGQPVAQVEPPPSEDVSDVRDELPPSLYEANGGDPKPKHAKKPSKVKDADDVTAAPPPRRPTLAVAPIKSGLCVTTGAATIGAKIEKPAMRAVAKTTDGEAASLTFTYQGETSTQKKLASGELRRQLGLKLRAENGCNLIYVMWRLDPKPMVYVQTKRNPGAKDHKACGAGGYKKVKPEEDKTPPELVFGEKHTLRAEIQDEVLSVYIDDDLHWRGNLPDNVRELRGPAGLRSDNLAYDLVDFSAPATAIQRGNAKCVAEDND